jgi:hypothetical protein
MDNGEGMVKKVRFTLDLRDVVEKSSKVGNIIEPMDIINDELLNNLVDEMIINHIKDFISEYIQNELEVGNLEFDGDLLF